MTDPLVPAGVSVHRDVVHTKLEGYRPLSLDLYLPDANHGRRLGALPLVSWCSTCRFTSYQKI